MTLEEIVELAETTRLSFSEEEFAKLELELNDALKNITPEQAFDIAWAATDLARIDGVRFAPSCNAAESCDNADTIDDLYKKTRTNHFDFETKKKILLGYCVPLDDSFKKRVKEIDFGDLREDVVEKSLPREEVMKKAPKTDGEFFIVPQVLE